MNIDYVTMILDIDFAKVVIFVLDLIWIYKLCQYIVIMFFGYFVIVVFFIKLEVLCIGYSVFCLWPLDMDIEFLFG